MVAAMLLGGAGVVCAWLWVERGRLRVEAERAAVERDEAAERARVLEGEKAELAKQVAVAEQTHAGLQKQIEQAHRQLRESFQSLAGEVLKKSSEQFYELAKRNFDSEKKDVSAQLDQRKQAIEQLVKPVREQLDKYNQLIQQVEKERKDDQGGLKSQLRSLSEDQRRLHKETDRLVSALRRSEVRGRWGEMQLKRLAELAGMIEHCDFDEQVSLEADGKRLQPDMLVRMPGERTIVVDAKTPLDGYLSALEAEDEQARQQHLQSHVRQIESKVRELAGKDYAGAVAERSPDFVVLFIPGESFLHAAVQLKPGLIEQAMERGVVIATPTTLISLLKVVALGWQEERLAENAQKIQELGQELHRRLATALGHLEGLGKAVTRTVGEYNKLVGSLESSVLPQSRRFEKLGVRSSKELPAELGSVEGVVREVRGGSDE